MSQALINELKRENLSTHFVLPLLKLNKFSFIASNFVNCYLSQDGLYIIVEVVEPQLLSRKVFLHPEFRGIRRKADGSSSYYLLYSVPVKWRHDVQLFIGGKYSRMTKAAKETIVRFSGLPHHEKTGVNGRAVTDGRLLALERHELLRIMWEEKLSSDRTTAYCGVEGTHIHIGEEEELLGPPGTESFINPDTLVSIKKAKLH